MADFLNKLYLYGDVKITRDYSTVHDLTPSAWLTYLKTQTPVWTDSVNYYRLPSVIRVEGNYDTLRKVTYGALEGIEPYTTPTFKRPVFFWVDEVRLVKQASYLDTDNSLVNDVVELVISPDVWSNNNGEFTLYDSYVERRHMDRWSGGKPIYYPDAGQGVDGAYKLEKKNDLNTTMTATLDGQTYTARIKFICLTAVDTDGKIHFYMSPFMTLENTTNPFYDTLGAVKYYDGTNTWYSMTPEMFLSDAVTADLGLTASRIQSIFVIEESNWENFFGPVNSNYTSEMDSIFAYNLGLDIKTYTSTDYGRFFVMEMKAHPFTFMAIMKFGKPVDMTVTPVAPSYTTPTDGMVYSETQEPMLYRAPARIRKLVSGIGGSLGDVPDLHAFDTTVHLRNMLDLTSGSTFVYVGDDVLEANSEGCIGVMQCPTLPIYSSAWKEYEAIAQAGDKMAYNAQQVATVANGLAGAAASGGMGAMASGGPVGGILGAVTSLVGMGASLYANDKSFEAKQLTIRNSPATVKSGGSGLGAIMSAKLTDLYHIVLKVDDVSYNSLKTQYYYYGYFIRKHMPGTIDLSTRKFFDFIKTSGAKVRGSLNASEAREIGAIFDRGVTIYHGTDGYAKIGTGMVYENYEV